MLDLVLIELRFDTASLPSGELVYSTGVHVAFSGWLSLLAQLEAAINQLDKPGGDAEPLDS